VFKTHCRAIFPYDGIHGFVSAFVCNMKERVRVVQRTSGLLGDFFVVLRLELLAEDRLA
jgi:hypothetical protein